MNGTMILAAHPDDETIGCGALIGHLSHVTVVHLTDGAPRERRFYPQGMDLAPDSYAAVRYGEAIRALNKAGLVSDDVHGLGARDQEAAWELVRLATAFYDMISRASPAVVITHSYEGGHPDHDSACFVAHTAAALVTHSGRRPPRLIEMTGYHASEGQFRSGQFLDMPDGSPSFSSATHEWVGGVALDVQRRTVTTEVATVKRWLSESTNECGVEWILGETDRQRKAEMFACFESQRDMLELFALEQEHFRAAPRYSFRKPPHEGPLYYEQPDCTLTGAEWRILAKEAERALGIEKP